MNKFRNKRVGPYDSKKEAKRAEELALLEKAGKISSVVHHPRFRLDVLGVHICDYEADFRYIEDGKLIVEDVKSEPTRKLPSYVLKKKLMLAVHGISVKEV